MSLAVKQSAAINQHYSQVERSDTVKSRTNESMAGLMDSQCSALACEHVGVAPLHAAIGLGDASPAEPASNAALPRANDGTSVCAFQVDGFGMVPDHG